MSDEEDEANEMRNALTEIAKEVQKFQKDSRSGDNNKNRCQTEEILGQLLKCKTSLNVRKIQIKRLRNTLKTACAVAKTMSSAKASETATLTTHLDIARKKYLNLIRKQSEKDEIITNLTTENRALKNQLEFFDTVIQRAYQAIQKMRTERIENISSVEKLQHILVCCGQYYADFCNERDKRIRLEQKNRFLNILMTIENNLKPKDKTDVRNNKDKKCAMPTSRQVTGFTLSEFKLGSNQKNFTNLAVTKIELNRHLSPTNSKALDLTTHLKTVKQLLNDQDNLIKDLKSLSKTINVDETYSECLFLKPCSCLYPLDCALNNNLSSLLIREQVSK